MRKNSPVGFRMPKSLRDEFERIAEDSHVDLTVLLNTACMEYLERKKHPEILRQEIRQVLQDDPSILDDPLKRLALQFYTNKSA